MSRRLRGVVLAVGIGLIIPVAAWFVMEGWRGPAGSRRYRKIIEQVENGTLKPNQYGTVALPRGLAGATVTGEVYVSKSGSGSLLILFTTWRGKGGNLRGYLYANPPMAAGDTDEDAYGQRVIDLAGPVDLGPSGTPPYWHDERVIEKQLDANWYVVYRDLD